MFISVFSVPTYAVDKTVATDDSVIKPMFSYINSMTHHFDINRYGKATAEALLNAFNGDKLMVEVELQQYDVKTFSWKTIKSWKSTVENFESCGAGGTWYVMSDNLYRSVARGYVYVNGEVVEDHEMVTSAKYYD